MRAEPREVSEATRLVGRTAEMATLQDLVGDVAGGSSVLVRLTGPSGLGKSRLAREAIRLADRAGFVTLVSRPTRYGEGTAFGAAVDALGPLLRARARPERARLVASLPQLGLLFAGIELEAAAPMPDAALQRLVLIEGLSRVVERLAEEGPLLWVVDGLEAIDRASVELLQRLAVSLADRPVLLLVTGPEGGGEAMGVLERACADCGWQRTRIGLLPLAEPDTVALAEDVLGSTASEPLRRAIRDRCAGIPLWITATAQALLDGGGLVEREGVLGLAGTTIPLPADLDEQMQATIRGLDGTGRALLVALAVAGGPLPFEVLASAVESGTTQQAVAELERRRLVTWTETGCDVAHGLLREVLLAHLPDTERRATHALLARSLRDRDPDDPRVAEHTLDAGPLAGPDLVPGELVHGARRARAIGATREAYRYLAAALAAYPDEPDGSADTVTAGLPAARALHAEAGQVAGELGDHEAARTHWERALAEYADAGLAVGTARAHRGLAGLDWAQGRLGDAQDHITAAEKALEGLEPGPELGEVYYARTVNAQRLADADAVRHEAGRLRELARRTSSPRLSARALLATAASAYARTDYTAAVRLNDEALAAAEQADYPALLVRAHDQASVAAAAVADLPGLRAHSRASVDVAGANGLTVLGWWPRARLAFADLMSGELDAALRTSADVVAVAERQAPPRGRVSCFAGHALLLIHHGHLDEARTFLDRSREAPEEVLANDRNVVTIVEYAAVALALAEGEPGLAQQAGARLAELAGGWVPLLGAALLAEAYATGDRPDEASHVAMSIAAVDSCPTSLPQTLVRWITGLTADDPARSIAELTAAVAGFEELGLLLHANRARLRLAATAGLPEETAVETLRHALGFFEAMGSPAPLRTARELLHGLGVTPPRARPPADTGGPLSPRELEVARLVAEGLSNAAVATELFISPRTVTTHLEHIYGKLGLSSRVALTRYLADSDLLEATRAQPAANT